MSYHLQLATATDNQDLVSIFVAAFSSDRITRLKAAHHHDHVNYVGSLIETPLKAWLTRADRYRVLKACMRDASSGTDRFKVIGWICWGFQGFAAEEVERLSDSVSLGDPFILASLRHQSHQDSLYRDNEVVEPTATRMDSPPSAKREVYTKHSVDELEARCSEAVHQWISDINTPGKTSLFIGSLCVLPEMQGRDVGSALLDWGVRLADTEHLEAWVQSSESGQKAFASKGFEEVRTLEIAVHEYTDDESLCSKGMYVYHYMIRRPRPCG